MGKIQNLPPEERPREKALRYGIEKLSNAELLSIVISSGTRKASALEIANNLLSHFGGIANLKYLRLNELISLDGISHVKALKLLAIDEIRRRMEQNLPERAITLNGLARHFSSVYRNAAMEKAYLVLLNRKKELLFIREIFAGNENSLAFSIKEVVSYIVAYSAHSYYLIHNHPSGNPMPSSDDIVTTTSLEMVTLGMGCVLIDHLIFSGRKYYSMNQKQIFSLDEDEEKTSELGRFF